MNDPTKEKPAHIPTQLLNQLARGNCILLLGSDASLDSPALARALAAECDYPAEKPDRTLPAVARYYQAMHGGRQAGRIQLVARLREWLEQHASAPTALHRAAARLPAKHLMDFGYGNQLSLALVEARRPYTLVLQDHALSYAEDDRMELIKPFGAAEQPETLVLTTEDYDRFLSTVDPSHPLLLEQLRLWAASLALLWVGVDPGDPGWRRLHRRLTDGIHPQHRREYALTGHAESLETWGELGITALFSPDPPGWLDDLARAAAALPAPAVDTLPGAGPLLGRRPYKFLDYYTAQDADLFFGREAWAERLEASILANPLVVLFGASGVGKTSLLQAGVTPLLSVRACWVVYTRPGRDALEAVWRAAGEALGESDRVALAGYSELGSFLQAAGERLGRPVVVMLDQAEECFTGLSDPARERWVAALSGALRQAAPQVHWVLSLREDFAAELHEWSRWVPQIFATTERLVPLGASDARQAISRPPTRVGVEIEADLVERLLADLTREGVEPVQLQIVCERLYQARGADNRMTLAAYQALGGAGPILAGYVDFALAQFPRPQQELAVALLKAMVTGRDTKLPLPPEEILENVAGDPAEKRTVLLGLVDRRLVRSLVQGEEARYELVHEALVEKVRSWIDAVEKQAHAARDLLRGEHDTWQHFQVLPETDKVLRLYAQRDNPYLHLDARDLELLLRASLECGVEPAFWAQRSVESGLDPWPILAPALDALQEALRIQAVWALAGWGAPQALEALRRALADVSPRLRCAAHQALFSLGSPQALVILDSSDDLRLVPQGEFLMGDDKRSLTLPAFFIEKYPLTNEKYARFIEAGGYRDPQHWTQAGWEWVRRSRREQPSFWKDAKWNQPNYPVVGVTWFEAWAYAAWAGRRLLSEAEWEKAARGVEGRRYPWGDPFEAGCCNTSESKHGGTTPVGEYSPDGDSPYGCADMAGNVWEWTSSLYKPYPYQASDGREDAEAPGNRVLRGGSWGINEVDARCASRYNYNPSDAYDYYGFRVGVSSRK